MLKAVIVSAIGGILSGRAIPNGWTALLIVMALMGAETAVEAIHHHLDPKADLTLFAVLDTVGSAAVLLGEVLAV